MPSSYLYLSALNRQIGTQPKWVGLPRLSQSTRECYLSVTYARLVLGTANTTLRGLVLKMKVSSRNYTSSNNDAPVIAMLDFNNTTTFTTPDAPVKINLLTNDNLTDVEFVLENQQGATYILNETGVQATRDNLEILFQIDYVDQVAVVEKYRAEMPMRL